MLIFFFCLQNAPAVNNEILEAQRKKQTELINQLKVQLEELESYAYESGEAIVPSNLLLERQRVVMGKNKARKVIEKITLFEPEKSHFETSSLNDVMCSCRPGWNN